MRVARLLLAIVTSSTVGAGSALAGAGPPKPAGSDNAALQYWQAFALMPTLDKDQEKLVEQWNSVPLDDAAQEVISRAQPSLKQLRRGAKLPRCDWGLDYDSGIAMQLPHLTKARALARLAALSIRSELAHGEPKTARENATALMVLARHVGADPLLVSLLVRFSTEGMVVDVIAPYVPQLKAPAKHVQAQFNSLPQGATLQQAVIGEKDIMARSIIHTLREADRHKTGAWRDMWKQILDNPDVPDEVKKADSIEAAVKFVQDLVPAYDELAKIVALAPKDFETQYPAFMEKTKAALPMAKILLPSMVRIVAAEHRNKARMAMLIAAFAVAQDGPDMLKDYPDPFGNGPFEYRALDKGFELKSKLLYDNKPVTLTIGQPGKS